MDVCMVGCMEKYVCRKNLLTSQQACRSTASDSAIMMAYSPQLTTGYEEIYAAIKMRIKSAQTKNKRKEKASAKSLQLKVTRQPSTHFNHTYTNTYKYIYIDTYRPDIDGVGCMCGQSKSYRMLHIMLTIELCVSAASVTPQRLTFARRLFTTGIKARRALTSAARKKL